MSARLPASLLLALALAACQPAPEETAFETKEATTTVHVLPVDDVAQVCAAVIGMHREQSYLTPPKACAKWQGHECTIYVPPTFTQSELGHELRHCLYGNFHR